MYRNLAPIVLFVYNRIEKVKNVINSLENCTLIHDSEVYIFSDAPRERSEKDRKKVAEVRMYLDELEHHHKSKSITIIKSETHKGLAESVIYGVSHIIKAKKKVIVIEDDLILSPNFLVYMNKALQHYRHDKKIWSISGYTMPLKALLNYKEDVYFAYRGCSWGWGTWFNRWDAIDWKVKDFSHFKKSFFLQYKLNRGGYDLSQMLINQMKGKIDSWAIRWCYAESKRNMLTVYPAKTLVWNDGMDGSGTNCGRALVKQMKRTERLDEATMINAELHPQILKEFQEYYGSSKRKWLEQYINELFL